MPIFAIVEAPSPLGLRPPGVERLPEALEGSGLAAGLSADVAARVEPPPYDPRRDPATDLLNPDGLREYSLRLADAVGAVLDSGRFPVVLGGDCSILLGSLLALRRRGRFGLLFLDGHTDFYVPQREPNGEVASMELALATGRGPAVLADLEGSGPLVRDEDVVVLGPRDAQVDPDYDADPLPPAMRSFDLAEVRRLGAEAAGRAAVEHLSRAGGPGHFWIHFDADVLDDAVMPAVDYRLPGGLRHDELRLVLGAAIASGRAVGLEATIYNPALDPGGAAGRALAAMIVEALGTDVGRE